MIQVAGKVNLLMRFVCATNCRAGETVEASLVTGVDAAVQRNFLPIRQAFLKLARLTELDHEAE